MSTVEREDILAALRNIRVPGGSENIVQAGLVSGVVIRGEGEAGFLITVDEQGRKTAESLRLQCEKAVAALPGVTKVTAVLTAETQPQQPAQPQAAPRPQAQWKREPVEHVKHVVLVASGKGGVGKSTVSVCLAQALAASGKRVGLLDADIYGPSIPKMMGITARPEVVDNRLVPLESHGVRCMSIGFLMEDGAAILRGPMITKALHQMVRQVAWGSADEPLDVLLIDLPPGTGDVQLSLAQQVAVSGAVVVTTPQEIAVIDARKAVQMFRKVEIPIFGILENMSYLEQPDSKAIIRPFGQGGGTALAKEMSTLFLGDVPLIPALGAAMDAGKKPDELPPVFADAAQTLLQQLNIQGKAA